MRTFLRYIIIGSLLFTSVSALNAAIRHDAAREAGTVSN